MVQYPMSEFKSDLFSFLKNCNFIVMVIGIKRGEKMKNDDEDDEDDDGE